MAGDGVLVAVAYFLAFQLRFLRGAPLDPQTLLAPSVVSRPDWGPRALPNPPTRQFGVPEATRAPAADWTTPSVEVDEGSGGAKQWRAAPQGPRANPAHANQCKHTSQH